MANVDRVSMEHLQPSETSQLQFPTDWDDQSRTTTGCSRYATMAVDGKDERGSSHLNRQNCSAMPQHIHAIACQGKHTLPDPGSAVHRSMG